MKKLFSLLFLFMVIFPVGASAMTFRRPLDTVLSPIARYFYDNNTGWGATSYACSSNTYNNHRGTDFRATLGTNIYSAASGTLYRRYDLCDTYGYLGSTCGDGFGNHVRIDHEGPVDGSGWVTIYAHMEQGSPVGRQDLFCSSRIGRVGSSGNSTAAHLHFEVRKYSYPNNDPFAGSCSTSGGFWTSPSSGTPSTTCGAEQRFRL